MDKLRTNTGKEFDCDYLAVIPSPPRAYIRVCNTSIMDVAAIFSDKAETALLRYGQHELAGHTCLMGINLEGDALKVTLTKE